MSTPTNILDTPVGGADAKKANIGGIAELFGIPKHLLGVLTTRKDAFGNVLEVTAIAPVGAAKFQQIDFKEQSADFKDDFKFGNNKFNTQTGTFVVETSGADANEQAHKILYERKLAFLAVRNNGTIQLYGHDLGLYATDGNFGTGGKYDDAATQTFTLTGANRGNAPYVTMDALDFEALVNRVA